MMLKSRLAIAAVALAAAFWSGWSWQDSRCDSDRLRGALERSEQAIDELSAQLREARRVAAAVERISDDRAAQMNDAAEKNKKLSEQVERLKNEMPDCIAHPLPDDLRERLRESLRGSD